MAKSAIINTGRAYIAQQIAASQTVELTDFVFANIANLDHTVDVDLDESLPAAADIVHEQAVTKAAFQTNETVLYSILLDTTVGDFDFNWIGLKATDGTLVAVSYVPSIKKIKTNAGVLGNSLTRNFVMTFNDAKQLTQINVSADSVGGGNVFAAENNTLSGDNHFTGDNRFDNDIEIMGRGIVDRHYSVYFSGLAAGAVAPKSFTGGNGSFPTCVFNSSKIAIINAGAKKLGLYEDVNGTWTLTGNELTLTGSVYDICALADGSVAVAGVSDGNGGLGVAKFTHNGTDWVQVGNVFTLANLGVYFSITALADDDIVIHSTSFDAIRRLGFDGANWSQTGIDRPWGNSFLTTKINITALSETRIVLSEYQALSILDWSNTTNRFELTRKEYGNSLLSGALSFSGDDHIDKVDSKTIIACTASGLLVIAFEDNNGFYKKSEIEANRNDAVWLGNDSFISMYPSDAEVLYTNKFVNSQRESIEKSIRDIHVKSFGYYGDNDFHGSNTFHKDIKVQGKGVVERFDDLSHIKWLDSIEQIGSSLQIANAGRSTVCQLSNNKIAYVSAYTDALQAYIWNGTNWATLGNSLSIPAGVYSMCYLADNRIAVLNSTSKTLAVYEHNGTDFSQVGATITLAQSSVNYIDPIDSQTVVIGVGQFIVQYQTNDNYQTWQTIGTASSAVAASIDISPIVVSPTLIIGVQQSNEVATDEFKTVLNAFRYDAQARTITSIGKPYEFSVKDGVVASNGVSDFCAYGGNMVVIPVPGDASVRVFVFDGFEFSDVLIDNYKSGGLGFSFASITKIADDTLAMHDDLSDSLRTLKVNKDEQSMASFLNQRVLKGTVDLLPFSTGGYISGTYTYPAGLTEDDFDYIDILGGSNVESPHVASVFTRIDKDKLKTWYNVPLTHSTSHYIYVRRVSNNSLMLTSRVGTGIVLSIKAKLKPGRFK